MADPTTIELGLDPFAIPEDQRRTWRALERDASGCTDCRLHEERTNVVFGSGDPTADLFLLGDAPSKHDDLLGESFVGGAGNLLTNSLRDAGVEREDVFVTTFVKCHPPGGRAPQQDEAERCSRYLLEQLAWARPRVIVTLGEIALWMLTGRRYPLDKVAGVRFDVHGAVLVPTYHPGAALQGDNRALEALRRDLATAAAVLDGTLTGRSGADAGTS